MNSSFLKVGLERDMMMLHFTKCSMLACLVGGKRERRDRSERISRNISGPMRVW